jgi:hypothetical protein
MIASERLFLFLNAKAGNRKGPRRSLFVDQSVLDLAFYHTLNTQRNTVLLEFQSVDARRNLIDGKGSHVATVYAEMVFTI